MFGYSVGSLYWLSVAGEVLSSFGGLPGWMFYRKPYAVSSWMAPGAAPWLWILYGQPATHDVPDPGFGTDEEVDSDQHLVEQWNDAEAT